MRAITRHQICQHHELGLLRLQKCEKWISVLKPLSLWHVLIATQTETYRVKITGNYIHWKRPWCWDRLGAGGEGDDRGCNGWMASLTQCTRVWVNSGSWWWTGRPGVLRFMGLQKVGHDWATELNWTDIQYPVINHNGKEYLKECIYVYLWVTLLNSTNDWHHTINQLHFNKKKF